MKTLKTIIAFIFSLPDLFKLVQQMIKNYEEYQLEEKIKQDLRKIEQAYADRDGDALARVFDKPEGPGVLHAKDIGNSGRNSG